MNSGRNLDAIAKACAQAASLIEQDGSQDLRRAMLVVLYILGREIAGQHAARDGSSDDGDEGKPPFGGQTSR